MHTIAAELQTGSNRASTFPERAANALLWSHIHVPHRDLDGYVTGVSTDGLHVMIDPIDGTRPRLIWVKQLAIWRRDGLAEIHRSPVQPTLERDRFAPYVGATRDEWFVGLADLPIIRAHAEALAWLENAGVVA